MLQAGGSDVVPEKLVRIADAHDCAAPCITVRFDVVADPDPQSLIRVLGLFAQRSLMPSAVGARSCSNELSVTITQPDITGASAKVIAEKLRASVLVRSVELISYDQQEPGHD